MYTKREVRRFIATNTRLHRVSDPLDSIYLVPEHDDVVITDDQHQPLYDSELHMHDRADIDDGCYMGDDGDDDDIAIAALGL